MTKTFRNELNGYNKQEVNTAIETYEAEKLAMAKQLDKYKQLYAQNQVELMSLQYDAQDQRIKNTRLLNQLEILQEKNTRLQVKYEKLQHQLEAILRK